MTRARSSALAAALAVAFAGGACAGQTGTIDLELTAAPGSTLLADVQHLRVTITDPHQVVEADRGANGFDLVLAVDATGAAGSLIVDGFDGNGALIATGASPPFPVAAINARIVVYMASPMSIGGAPTLLPGARKDLASAALSYGLVLAGGTDAAGVATDEVFVYNSFDHSLLPGKPMPAPRAQQTLAVGSNNTVSMFGGTGADGVPTGTLWRFDTTVPPNGSFLEVSDEPELARAGAIALTVGVDRHVITGTPAIDLVFETTTARADVASLSPPGAVANAGEPIAVFAGDPIVRLRGDAIDTLASSVEPTASAAALPDGRVVFASPGAPPTRDLVVVDPATGDVATLPGVLSSARQRAAIAATARHLIVAGGLDESGSPVATADVLDAVSLALVATVPCVARSGASAFAFANDQIAIAGGAPESAVIELFTPPPAE